MAETLAHTNRETVTDLLSAVAHMFDTYPSRVESIGVLVVEHLDQDAGASGPAAGSTPAEQAMARFQRIFGSLMQDQRMKDLKRAWEDEYVPPPYTQLPSVPGGVTEGEPVSFTTAVIAVGLALAGGAAIGTVIPL